MTGRAEEKRCFALAERLQKLIAAAGLCSRRTAEEWIAAGRVCVNGETATIGQSADPETDTICVDGVPLTPPERRVYLMLNKPRGYVTTLHDERGRKTVADLVASAGERLYPVGRLDLDSEGLLILTNDGEIANCLMHPSHEITKTYEVDVAGGDLAAAAEVMHAVTELEGYRVRPAEVMVLAPDRLSVTIHEGRNRQVRRLCALAGLRVLRLVRVAEGELRLGTLAPRQWRELTDTEIAYLKSHL